MSNDHTPAREFPTNVHWVDYCLKNHLSLGLGNINQPRMSAQTMLKLVELKNSMGGVSRSLYEESLVAEEKNVHPITL